MEKILIIRLSAMGDVAISVPVVNAFQEQYPNVEITILTKKNFTPIFSKIPNCKVIEIDTKEKHKGFFGLLKLFFQLKKEKFTFVADLHGVLRTHILKLFFIFLGIPVVQINKGRAEKKALVRAKNKIFKPLKPSFERYADVFKKLGFPLVLSEKNTLGKQTTEITKKIFTSEKKRIGIAPFAAHLGKQYPFEKMKIVIEKLSQNTDYQIFLLGGGAKEKELLHTFSYLENVQNMVGKYNFETELDIISQLDIMVAMDSGNAHLSAMFGVPTLTIWGVTHPFAGFYPFGQPEKYALVADRNQFPLVPTSVFGNQFTKGYEKAIETILPIQILEKIHEILNEK